MNGDRDAADTLPVVTNSMAMQLFCAILGESALPIDLLAARCAAVDGAEWSRSVLDQCSTTPTTREGWIAWKVNAKMSIRESDLRAGDSVALGFFLRYFGAIAGCLALDGSLISTIDRAEIRRGLIVIGPSLPGDWRSICATARQRIDQEDSPRNATPGATPGAMPA